MKAVVESSSPDRPISRILLVDDDAAVRQSMGRALRQAGLLVIEAEDGDAAIELIAGPAAFDMLVTDVRMPGQSDGVAVAAVWRRQAPGRPILFVSGFDDHQVNAANLGLNEAMLPKPFPRAVLVDAVCTLLESATPAAA